MGVGWLVINDDLRIHLQEYYLEDGLPGIVTYHPL